MARFSSQIYKLGINPVVDPPKEVLGAIFKKAGRSKGPIPVRGTLNGVEFIQTLVKFAGTWRLYVNGKMLKDSRLKVGDVANIEIEIDTRPRDVPVPKELADALAESPAARKAFDALAPSRRNEILRYLGSLKTNASLEKNIAKVMGILLAKKKTGTVGANKT